MASVQIFSAACILLTASLQQVLSSTYEKLVQPLGTTCLLCPTNSSDYDAVWKKNDGSTEILLFRHDIKRHRNEDFFLVVNSQRCNASYYSLEVNNVTNGHNDGNYTCWKYDENLASFYIAVKAYPAVYITSETHVKPSTSSDITANCHITEAVPPFNITWFVDQTFAKEEFIKEPSELGTKWTANLTVNVTKPTQIVCAVDGRYIAHANDSWQINIDTTKSNGNEPSGALYAIVPALFTLSMLTSFCLYFRVKRHNKAVPGEGQTSITLDHGVTNVEETNDNVVYDDVNDEENPSKDDTKANGQQSDDYETKLVACVKTSGMFEYWNATYTYGDPRKTTKCFAKALSGSATMTDASAFQVLARKLKALKDHQSVLKLLCISVDELPYSIFYEYMECGSLRDFMMRHYQEARQSYAFSRTGGSDYRLLDNMKKQQAELLYFASNIAKGMRFICSQKFSHPAVSLKKVLISEDCECKLYDICPTETAMRKVDELMKKEHPPIAWLAPETVFLQDYTYASDVWGFAVLMWEIFSLGQVPFARRSKSEIEQQIREGVVLTQPLCCPGAIYGLMLSSWNTNQQKRPTFDELVKKIDSMAKKLREETTSSDNPRALSEGNENSYFVLNPAYSSHDNYI